MNGEALGVIEVIGMAAAIEAADTCVKSANVELIGYELTKGSGLVTIKIRGNVGAVKAALEAAKISSGKVNKVYASLIIPRPAESLESIIESSMTIGIESNKSEMKENVKDSIENNIEDTQECDNESVKQVDVISFDDNKEELEHVEDEGNEDICNICHDPKCLRRKGQSRSLCIHYEQI
ncbi:BMC domain-containing protein [Clostridium peptidivorans]|uniref:BMC domain-containing protein n=1 Tax=Clostridium peptidivorans TaxID=100174 RepID=UPI000BE3FCC7|nr:BMC domain-containing protein [Clostridium peptidivorans]